MDSRRRSSSSKHTDTKQTSSSSSRESRKAIASALRKRSGEEIAESAKKIAEKKVRLAKYGVKFQSAGHLATIEDISSYQSSILNAKCHSNPTSSSSTATSTGLYGRFVSAGKIMEEEIDVEKREQRLSELPQASGRIAEQMEAAEKEDGSDDEDFTAQSRIIQRNETKKTVTTKKMTLKLTDKYESYYY